MATALLRDKEAKDLNLIPLSTDTFKNRIRLVWKYWELINSMCKKFFFTLELDENLDTSSNVNLVVFVHYEFCDKICENFLFWKFLPSHTSSILFTCTDSFM